MLGGSCKFSCKSIQTSDGALSLSLSLFPFPFPSLILTCYKRELLAVNNCSQVHVCYTIFHLVYITLHVHQSLPLLLLML